MNIHTLILLLVLWSILGVLKAQQDADNGSDLPHLPNTFRLFLWVLFCGPVLWSALIALVSSELKEKYWG